MKIAYLDASSGVSGDMLLAAGIAAGASLDRLNQAIARLGLDVVLSTRPVQRSGMEALQLIATRRGSLPRPLGELDQAPDHQHTDPAHAVSPEPAHPHPPLPEKSPASPSGSSHSHAHQHPERQAAPAPHQHAPDQHAPDQQHPHPHHPHVHNDAAGHVHGRSLKQIVQQLEGAGLSPTVTARARAAFQILGEAEARVHGVDSAAVHFHEVGQDDAIIDIVGVAWMLEELGIERLIVSPLNTGSGSVQCAHGLFAVPAPATLELLRGLPVYSSGLEAELVTPTGAALVRALAQSFGPLPAMRPERVGYGAGSYEIAGAADMLRLIVGQETERYDAPQAATADAPSGPEPVYGDRIVVLEASIDDMSGELYGYVVERVLEAGALDVYTQPLQMKKNRPGVLVTVLARPADAQALTDLLLSETTTLGVRQSSSWRATLERVVEEVLLEQGRVRIKVALHEGHVRNVAPEYEDCREIARRTGIPLKNVYRQALEAWWRHSESGEGR